MTSQGVCVDAIFEHYRATGFPVYDLSPRERRERLAALMGFDHATAIRDNVIRQKMHGMSLCWHYHPHAWEIKCGNKRTPMDIFLSDALLKKAIAKRLETGTYITDGALRKALYIFQHAACEHFHTYRYGLHLPRVIASQWRNDLGFFRRLWWAPAWCLGLLGDQDGRVLGKEVKSPK